ncbi:hypothetical protein FKM82_002230, partial [Ascaphus truei]
PMSQEEQNVQLETHPHMEVARVDQLEEHSAAVFQPRHGRLLKARLKPLRPVHIQDPTVAVCQGMVPERIQSNPALYGLTMLQQQMLGDPALRMQIPGTPETLHYTSLVSLAGLKAERTEELL